MTLQIAPGCELHLLMGQSQQIRVLDNSTLLDVAASATYSNFGANVQQTSIAALLRDRYDAIR